MNTKEPIVATTRSIRRIQGEMDPPLKLSELTPRERFEVLDVRVRDLKPLLRYMPVERLEKMQIIDPPSEHTASYGEGLRSDTKALPVFKLLGDDRTSLLGHRLLESHWLALTVKGTWIYWDAEGRGSEAAGYVTSSAFSLVPHKEMLDMLQGDSGVSIVQTVARSLLQYAQNILRSREQQAEETRRLFEGARVLTRDVVDLHA